MLGGVLCLVGIKGVVVLNLSSSLPSLVGFVQSVVADGRHGVVVVGPTVVGALVVDAIVVVVVAGSLVEVALAAVVVVEEDRFRGRLVNFLNLLPKLSDALVELL